ncbi:hypothetical protein PR001_g17376 [Phytophthora rubi]|uniref:Uncharacterized protein n=1 Tax=Phytophthora rubi TaxID=129364 RepID=A0A6A3KD84_9STRA|nr:hypothetical protein PR002_g17771 [Phytophthora rubi]KAE9005729.1 hypothetical protein PR001_g17376 [Phytophthora rubi]
MANVADVANLASSLQAGVTSVLGVKADFKAHLPIATPGVLEDADGKLLGIPTRFDMLPAQAKDLFDAGGGI